MRDQKNDNRNQNLNPNNSDNLRDLRNTDLNRSGSQKGQHHGSSSTLDSLMSPSTIGMGTDGSGQNYSSSGDAKSTDQNRSGSVSGQTGSEYARGRMKGHEVKGDSAAQTSKSVSNENIQKNSNNLYKDQKNK